MPFRRPRPEIAPPADPQEWRPQRFGTQHARSVPNPIVEPDWDGVRVLVHVEGGRAHIRDEEGVDCTAEFSALADEIGVAALAEKLVLDGFLTVQPTQDTTGIVTADVPAPTGRQVVAQLVGGGLAARAVRRGEGSRAIDPEKPVAFVAVDLLALDDDVLFDVPLLERKRLLDGAVEQTEAVRITPFVRPPLGSFVTSWRALGFGGIVYKDGNSRYRPGAGNDGWAWAAMPRS